MKQNHEKMVMKVEKVTNTPLVKRAKTTGSLRMIQNIQPQYKILVLFQ